MKSRFFVIHNKKAPIWAAAPVDRVTPNLRHLPAVFFCLAATINVSHVRTASGPAGASSPWLYFSVDVPLLNIQRGLLTTGVTGGAFHDAAGAQPALAVSTLTTRARCLPANCSSCSSSSPPSPSEIACCSEVARCCTASRCAAPPTKGYAQISSFSIHPITLSTGKPPPPSTSNSRETSHLPPPRYRSQMKLACAQAAALRKPNVNPNLFLSRLPPFQPGLEPAISAPHLHRLAFGDQNSLVHVTRLAQTTQMPSKPAAS